MWGRITLTAVLVAISVTGAVDWYRNNSKTHPEAGIRHCAPEIESVLESNRYPVPEPDCRPKGLSSSMTPLEKQILGLYNLPQIFIKTEEFLIPLSQEDTAKFLDDNVKVSINFPNCKEIAPKDQFLNSCQKNAYLNGDYTITFADSDGKIQGVYLSPSSDSLDQLFNRNQLPSHLYPYLTTPVTKP